MALVYRRIELSITEPPANETVQGSSLHIGGQAHAIVYNTNEGVEQPMPVSKITISVTGADSITNTGSLWNFSETFTITSSGEKKIDVTAYYGSHDQIISRNVTVEIDEDPPDVIINEPINGVTIDGPNYGHLFHVKVSGSAQDPSGIKCVQYRVGDSGSFHNVENHSGSATSWVWHQDIYREEPDTYTIYISATDDNVIPNTSQAIPLTITFKDVVPPEIYITSPEVSPHKITWVEGGISVVVLGTASDPTTGVQSVQWQLDGGNFNDAINLTGTWSNWRFEANIPAPGLHEIKVRATDGPGNPNTDTVQIDVAVPFELEDVGYSAYLADLMTFTQRRVCEISGASPIEKALLTSAFHQPFDRLTESHVTSIVSKPVAQVRIAVEVLRSYLSNSDPFEDYCESAYRLLLTNIGTSYTEIRLVRAADAVTRQALANRLGIDVPGLDQLFISPDKLTEQKLESLFGLMDTTQDPLRVALNQAELLSMQLSHLHQSWLERDKFDYDNTDEPTPTIDPDIINEADLKSPIAGNTAYDLFLTRRRWINDQYQAIQNTRESKTKPLDGFNQVIQLVLGDVNLPALEQDYHKGVDIEPALASLKLSMNAFFVLTKVQKLAAAPMGVVLDAEWSELYDILVQVKKKQQFSAWTQAEIMANLSLKPSFFVQSDSRPELQPWRATWRARRSWEKKLDAHVKQRDALIQAHQSAIEATEEVVLPLLRDRLIDTIDRNGFPDVDVADWLTQRLSISYNYSGNQKLTRLEQGIETLQDLLQALRTGRLDTLSRLPIGTPVPKWVLAISQDYDEFDFDKEWEWMGTYATWRGAMFAFGYPENYLLPTLRDKAEWTNAFSILVKSVRQSWRLTPKKAEELAKQYLDDLYNIDHEPTFFDRKDDEGNLIHTIELTCQLTKKQLGERREDSYKKLKDYVDQQRGGLKPNTPSHLKEVYFFVPMYLAQSLQKKGEYRAALDWFQTVFAYELLPHERKIYYGLEAEEAIPTEYRRTLSWLLKGLDVFDIANDRANAITRYTLLSIARCYLAFSDAEFTRETNESIPLARRLYITALNLLDLLEVPPPVAHWTFDEDEGAAATDVTGNGHTATLYGCQWVANGWRNGAVSLNGDSDRVEIPHAPALALGKNGADFSIAFFIYLRQEASEECLCLVRKGAAGDWKQRTPGIFLCPDKNRIWFRISTTADHDEGSVSRSAVGLNTWTHVAYVKQGRKLKLYLNGQFDQEESLKGDSKGFDSADAPLFIGHDTLHRPGTNALFDDVRVYDRALNADSVIAIAGINVFPRNPVVDALKLRAELNLKKLRSGRNIAGIERIRMKPTAAELVVMDGSLVPPSATNLRPTAYRYSVLIDRAKQLVTIAQQLEANFFAALEKRDAEAYNLLNAQHDVQLTKETVELQDLRIQEASSQIVLMGLHQDRAQTQYNNYNNWIVGGPNHYERMMLQNYREIKDKQNSLAKVDTILATANSVISAASACLGKDFIAAAAAATAAEYGLVRGSLQTSINTLELDAQNNSFNANLECRKDEWRLQRALAKYDIDIAAQQLFQAEINKQVVEQERVIANMRAEQAEAIVEFLNNKFTNIELYEWMSDILSEVYSYFLQQATAMAQLALGQLAFERQEQPPAYIRSDYWQAPNDTATQNEPEGEIERRGITGSARLLQDIYQLDQYAFETNKRKLQLVEHFSLARMVPYEFQRFRESGVLPFATPMLLFDRGFPGHYLRLIKRVRLSLVGLIPPTQGIRATLRAAGVSRVVAGNGGYKMQEVRRPPESIAFTSPTNATGLFELQPENEMLLPFETMGVDASWELQLPKAANRFNFDSIADVIFTMEYTALESTDYRHQVIEGMDRIFSAERAFSVKREFPDLWYHLHHPETLIDPDSGNIHASIVTQRAHFPPNLETLLIDHVVLYFAGAEQALVQIDVADLRFNHNPTAVGVSYGGATTVDGVISTRRSNASGWVQLIGKSPTGEWTFAFADTPEFRAHFSEQRITDVLLVVSYSGDTPAWPE